MGLEDLDQERQRVVQGREVLVGSSAAVILGALLRLLSVVERQLGAGIGRLRRLVSLG